MVSKMLTLVNRLNLLNMLNKLIVSLNVKWVKSLAILMYDKRIVLKKIFGRKVVKHQHLQIKRKKKTEYLLNTTNC